MMAVAILWFECDSPLLKNWAIATEVVGQEPGTPRFPAGRYPRSSERLDRWRARRGCLRPKKRCDAELAHARSFRSPHLLARRTRVGGGAWSGSGIDRVPCTLARRPSQRVVFRGHRPG